VDLIQRHVDELAAILDRGVVVDDTEFRMLAHSAHDNNIDAVRRQGILSRTAPADIVEWVMGFAPHRAEGLLRIPPNSRFAMRARVCIPIRLEGALLGYLWMLDEPSPVPADATAEIGHLHQRRDHAHHLAGVET